MKIINKIIKPITFSIVICALSGCDLEEYPYGFYSENNFYKTVDEAESSLMYAYNPLSMTEYVTGLYFLGELPTETVSLKSGEDTKNPGSQALDEWNISNNQNNSVLQQFFKYCYIAINRANAVIDNVNNATFNEEDKKRILGEAHFLRGYSYFNLVKNFGLVPLQKKMVSTVDDTQPKMAKDMDEMYNFMIEDFKLAHEYLSYTRKVGRANRAAAEGFLAKLYLTAASSKESGVKLYSEMSMSVDDMYNEAAKWAKQVLDVSVSGKADIGLSEDLYDIYDVDKPDGPEHLFMMSMDRSGLNPGNYSSIGMYFAPNNNGNDYFAKYKDKVFPVHYGFEVFQTNDDFYDSYNASDIRKTQLMNTELYNADGTSGGSAIYPYTLKYTDPKQVTEGTVDKSSIKPYLLRFTDVALMYVEAVGSDEGGWLKKIRERAGLANIPSGLSKEDFRAKVIEERGYELAFEANRLYDLRRKGMVTRVDENAKRAGITESDAAFYPIPQMEQDLNKQ